MLHYCVLVIALTITFGSLYQDEIEITRKNVVGVLAAATLFSLVCIDQFIWNYFHIFVYFG